MAIPTVLPQQWYDLVRKIDLRGIARRWEQAP
jgi:hypothetical protein